MTSNRLHWVVATMLLTSISSTHGQTNVGSSAGSQPVAAQDDHRHKHLKPLKMVTASRIGELTQAEHGAWTTYLDSSNARAIREREILGAEVARAGAAISIPAPADSAEFEVIAKLKARDWLKTAESRGLAEVVLSYQTPSGGWSKGVDYSKGVRGQGVHWTTQSGAGWHYCGTLDNRSTTEQIRFLAEMYVATEIVACRDGAVRGLQWLLAAQYPNGGWPQVYPLEPGYHEAITLNDGAMTHALELLIDVAAGKDAYNFIDDELRQRAAASVKNGIACLLRCQIRIDGRATVWCAQHDPITLAPVAARPKEPASLSGGESADLVKFFMRKVDDSPAMQSAVEDAVTWFSSHRINGLRKTKNAAGKTEYVSDPDSGVVYWARFYDLVTQQPIFAGAQDGIIYSSLAEMARNNKVGYDFYSTRPRDVVNKEYVRWKKRFAR